jgi:hypothetical protein
MPPHDHLIDREGPIKLRVWSRGWRGERQAPVEWHIIGQGGIERGGVCGVAFGGMGCGRVRRGGRGLTHGTVRSTLGAVPLRPRVRTLVQVRYTLGTYNIYMPQGTCRLPLAAYLQGPALSSETQFLKRENSRMGRG